MKILMFIVAIAVLTVLCLAIYGVIKLFIMVNKDPEKSSRSQEQHDSNTESKDPKDISKTARLKIKIMQQEEEIEKLKKQIDNIGSVYKDCLAEGIQCTSEHMLRKLHRSILNKDMDESDVQINRSGTESSKRI